MASGRERLIAFVIAVIVVAFLIQFFGWYFPQNYGETDTRLKLLVVSIVEGAAVPVFSGKQDLTVH